MEVQILSSAPPVNISSHGIYLNIRQRFEHGTRRRQIGAARRVLNSFEVHLPMTINLHAVTDFEKGDVGRVTGHRVAKVEPPGGTEGVVVALQYVKAGSNGWFERK